MLTLLAFGTLWFWIVAAAVFCAIVALVENEKGFWAGVCLLGSLAAFYFLGNSGMLGWVRSNPTTILWFALAYIGGAAVWGLIKWYLWTTGESEKYEEAKTHFLKDNSATALTPKLKVLWTKVVKDSSYRPANTYGYHDIAFTYPAPEARHFKGKIIAWMTYWPWSAFWTLLNDPIRRLMRLMYSYMSGMFNAISKHAYRNAASDVLSKDDLVKESLKEI